MECTLHNVSNTILDSSNLYETEPTHHLFALVRHHRACPEECLLWQLAQHKWMPVTALLQA